MHWWRILGELGWFSGYCHKEPASLYIAGDSPNSPIMPLALDDAKARLIPTPVEVAPLEQELRIVYHLQINVSL